jgi:hypothetical protein
MQARLLSKMLLARVLPARVLPRLPRDGLMVCAQMTEISAAGNRSKAPFLYLHGWQLTNRLQRARTMASAAIPRTSRAIE